jgi:phosphonate transport system permease protein
VSLAAAQPGATERFARRLAEHRAAKRRQLVLFGSLFAAALVASAIIGEVDPARLAAGLPNIADYIGRTLPTLRAGQVAHDLGEWFWGIDLWLILLADTVLMAIVGTVSGGIIGLALCFDAAGNLARGPLGFFLARRLLDLLRSVPELVFALIFVFAFGPGPFAGVIALGLHAGGALGKLFAEVVENAEPGPLQAVEAAGGSRMHVIRFAVVPQVLPNMLSYLLLRFEINVRSASVLGVVGAGGICEELYLVVRQFIYADISAIVLLILVTVAVIDMLCEQLRLRLIEAAPPSGPR